MRPEKADLERHENVEFSFVLGSFRDVKDVTDM
jgi:hypothetical protein